MINKLFSAAVLFSICLTRVYAADNLYGVFSLGYADAEYSVNESQGGAYKLAVGYQFDPQWYAEFGYQQLVDESLASALPNTDDAAQNFTGGMQGSALFASVLGKAAGRMGELYYRLGLLKTDIKGQDLLSGSAACELGTAREFAVDSGQAFTLCEYDEGGLAGVIGIGFDFYVDTRTMIRAEIEYIQGENDLKLSTAFIGLRYNF